VTGKNSQEELEIEADSKLCYTTGHDISKKKHLKLKPDLLQKEN